MTSRSPSITVKAIETATAKVDAGKATSVVLRDRRVAGLSLAIGRTSQRWRLDYKTALADGGWSSGKRLALGDLATMTLDEARDAAVAAKEQVAAGIDPVAAKRAKRQANVQAAASQTVRAAIERFTEERAPDWTAATRLHFRGDFAVVLTALGDAPMALVERAALMEIINDFLATSRAKGASGLRRATRIAQLLGALWRQAGPGTPSRPGWEWPGIDPQVADRLPVVGRHRLASRRRILTEQEIKAVWRMLQGEGAGVGRGPRLALMLSLATGLRIGAIALTRVADLDLDPSPIVGARDNGPTIRIPAEDGRKATVRERREGADLVLPLSPFAVALWREALAIGDPDRANVFCGHKGRPMSANTVSKAWRDLPTPDDTVAHDLRRTMRSHLGEIDHGGAYEDEERLIGHSVGNAVARTYDRGRRLARLRPLADAWGARLEQIVSGQTADVLAIPGAAE